MSVLKYFIKIENVSFNVVVPIVGKEIKLRPFSVLHAATNLVGIFYGAKRMIGVRPISILGVIILSETSFVTLLDVFDIHMECFGPEDMSKVYDALATQDPTTASPAGWDILGFIIMKYFLLATSSCITFLENLPMNQSINVIAKILPTIRCLEAVILKRFVIKRLKEVRVLSESTTSLNQVITNMRNVIRDNAKINQDYGLIAGASAITHSLQYLMLFYRAWLVFGLKEELDDGLKQHPSTTAVFFLAVSLPSVLLAFYCSRVIDEIEEIKFELDITMTARTATKRQRKMIGVLLQELSIESIHLSPLGLFTIYRHSLAAVSGFEIVGCTGGSYLLISFYVLYGVVAAIISYLLVFIQFS